MDRRVYERIQVKAKGSFIIHDNDDNVAEFNGYIDDISEGGIKIKVDANEYEGITSSINEGNSISFQALDSFNLYGDEVTEIFSGHVKVVRKELGGNNLYLGCVITPLTKELQKYIDDRKVSLFINRMHMDY